VGGFAGAAIAKAGLAAIFSAELLKIISFIVLAPIIGMVVSFLFTVFTFLYISIFCSSQGGQHFSPASACIGRSL
jgi:phosphate/sulfate permease